MAIASFGARSTAKGARRLLDQEPDARWWHRPFAHITKSRRKDDCFSTTSRNSARNVSVNHGTTDQRIADRRRRGERIT
jgi:hypothetical protein